MKVATEQFFEEFDAMVMRRIRAAASSDEGRAELVSSTGIEDPALIDELSRLGIDADALISLRLFPLVLVAWAEEHVDDAEREAIMGEALKLGIREDSLAWLLLESWMKKSPPSLGVDAWKRYTHECFSKMSKLAQEKLIALTEHQMRAVAEASGGHMGFGKVSAKEQAIMHRVTEAMREQAVAQ